MIGKRKMNQFIEYLLRPHVLDSALDEGHQAVANDQTRETDARKWCETLAKAMMDEAR